VRTDLDQDFVLSVLVDLSSMKISLVLGEGTAL
jgi:hypothetical protein